MRRSILLAGAVSLVALPVIGHSQQDMSPEERALDVRHGHMQLYAFNLGPIGAMAQGEAEFDPAVVELRATNIANIARIDQQGYWIEGTSSEELEESRALPAIWENREDFESQTQALVEAAENLAAAAPQGQEAFTQAFREMGGACGSCHEDYRQEQ